MTARNGSPPDRRAELRAAGTGVRRHRTATTVGAGAVLALLGVGIATGRPNWPVYAAVLAAGAVGVVALAHRVPLTRPTVWGLVAFGVGHAAGGMVPVGDGTLYGVWLVGDVVRYDNVQHAIGFGFVGRAIWESLRGRLQPRPADLPRVAGWVVVLAACAAGAVNEIVEYVMTLTIPGTDVGGYDNTARDLIANLVGAVAVGWWTARRVSPARSAGRR